MDITKVFASNVHVGDMLLEYFNTVRRIVEHPSGIDFIGHGDELICTRRYDATVEVMR